MSIDGLEEIIPQSNQQTLLMGRGIEIKQPLMDLGYWSPGQALGKAIVQFREEYQAFKLLSDFSPSLNGSNTDLSLDALELQILHLLCSLDGDFKITQLPELGEQNLCTRILHYRLQILGLYPDFIEAPFSEKSRAALIFLQKLIPTQGGLTGTIHLAGDLPNLLRKLSHSGQLKERIVVFKYENPKMGKKVRKEISEEAESQLSAAETEKAEKEIEKELKELRKLSKIQTKTARKSLKGAEKREAQLKEIEKMINGLVQRADTQLNDHLQIIEINEQALQSTNSQVQSILVRIVENKSKVKGLQKEINAFNKQLNKIEKEEQIQEKIKQLENRNSNFKVLQSIELDSNIEDFGKELQKLEGKLKLVDRQIAATNNKKQQKKKRTEKKIIERKTKTGKTAFEAV